MEELAAAKKRADEETAIAKVLNAFTSERIMGEMRAASNELSGILDEIVDARTLKSKRAEFVASVHRFKRANDTMRSLAQKWSRLPPREVGPEDEEMMKAGTKAIFDAAQKMQKMIGGKKFPVEMMGVVKEALEDEPTKK